MDWNLKSTLPVGRQEPNDGDMRSAFTGRLTTVLCPFDRGVGEYHIAKLERRKSVVILHVVLVLLAT